MAPKIPLHASKPLLTLLGRLRSLPSVIRQQSETRSDRLEAFKRAHRYVTGWSEVEEAEATFRQRQEQDRALNQHLQQCHARELKLMHERAVLSERIASVEGRKDLTPAQRDARISAINSEPSTVELYANAVQVEEQLESAKNECTQSGFAVFEAKERLQNVRSDFQNAATHLSTLSTIANIVAGVIIGPILAISIASYRTSKAVDAAIAKSSDLIHPSSDELVALIDRVQELQHITDASAEQTQELLHAVQDTVLNLQHSVSAPETLHEHAPTPLKPTMCDASVQTMEMPSHDAKPTPAQPQTQTSPSQPPTATTQSDHPVDESSRTTSWFFDSVDSTAGLALAGAVGYLVAYAVFHCS
eukprot:m.192776 g.192776  ORF g.192776 m.192776 type:complete len:360 (-) comp14865_c0_seq2:952-2031(-)